MGKQEIEFSRREGDRWYERNKNKFNDQRNKVIANRIEAPSSIIEIGCGDGRYLADLRVLYDAKCLGIDPSDAAITEGRRRYPDLVFVRGTASYRFLLMEYDLLIYGFCLYLCDRESLASIVAIGNNALNDKGYLVIHDFDPDYPHKVPYHHAPGLFSFKMDYSKLWLANPAYSLVHKEVIEDGTAIWILKKDIEAGWPLGEVT